jgi:hypothetical protein
MNKEYAMLAFTHPATFITQSFGMQVNAIPCSDTAVFNLNSV